MHIMQNQYKEMLKTYWLESFVRACEHEWCKFSSLQNSAVPITELICFLSLVLQPQHKSYLQSHLPPVPPQSLFCWTWFQPSECQDTLLNQPLVQSLVHYSPKPLQNFYETNLRSEKINQNLNHPSLPFNWTQTSKDNTTQLNFLQSRNKSSLFWTTKESDEFKEKGKILFNEWIDVKGIACLWLEWQIIYHKKMKDSNIRKRFMKSR